METINTLKFINDVADLIATRPPSTCLSYILVVKYGKMQVVPLTTRIDLGEIFFTFTRMEVEEGITLSRWNELQNKAQQVMEAIEKCKTT